MTNTTFAAALRYFGLFFATLRHIVGASAIAALLLFFVSSPEPSTNRLIDGGLALTGCAFGWWAMDFFYGLSLLCADWALMAAKSPKKIKIKDGRFLLPSLVYGFSAMFAAYFLFFGAHASLLRVYAGGTFVMLGLISACIAVGCYYLVCRMDKEQTRSD